MRAVDKFAIMLWLVLLAIILISLHARIERIEKSMHLVPCFLGCGQVGGIADAAGEIDSEKH